jgi:hypothetical protein
LNGALFSSNIFHDITGAISTSGMRHLTKTKEENLGNHIHTSSRAGSRRNQQSSIVYSSRKRCDEIYGHFFWGSQQHLTTIIINQNIRNESRTFSSSSLFFFFLSSIFRSSVSFFDSQRVWTSAVCSPNFVGRSFLKEKKRLPDAMNPDPLLYIS